MTTVRTRAKHERDDLRPVDLHLADEEAGVRGRQVHRARLVAPDPRHGPEEDQREAERGDGLDERVAVGERRAEQDAVDERDDPAERDADDVGDAGRDAAVVDERPGDERAHGADGAEREVENAGRPVEDDHADAGQRVDAAQRETGHDERLEVLPGRHARRSPSLSSPRPPPAGTRERALRGAAAILTVGVNRHAHCACGCARGRGTVHGLAGPRRGRGAPGRGRRLRRALVCGRLRGAGAGLGLLDVGDQGAPRGSPGRRHATRSPCESAGAAG